MKKKYLCAEFIIIFILLVIPPLFQGPAGTEKISIANGGHFSVMAFIQLLTALALVFQFKKNPLPLSPDSQDRYYTTGVPEKQRKYERLIQFMTWCPTCFGLLMISQALVTGLAILLRTSTRQDFIFPSGFWQWTTFFANLSAGVFYEEALYRLFLPDTAIYLAGGKKNMTVICEALCIMIFAFSHRYLGIPAILNAAICGLVLRVTKNRTKSIVPSTLAHLLYNILQTILIYLLVQR